MKYILREVSISVKDKSDDFEKVIANKLNIDENDISEVVVLRRSLDARKKNRIIYKYIFVFELKKSTADRLVQSKKIEVYNQKQLKPIEFGNDKLDGKVVVVGAGPCGLFSAHTLCKMGYKVLLIERGKDMHERKKDVQILHKTGVLDENSNVCFGEGGAGTFSDGKLTTRIKDLRAKSVLETFVRCGADSDILFEAKPHLGTDGMQRIIKNLRAEILELGGEVIFNAKLSDIIIEENAITGVEYIEEDETTKVKTNAVVLATGHSAKDVFYMVHDKGVHVEKKATAIGFRVEHKRDWVDKLQYADFVETLGAAEYSMTAKNKGRGIYTFCMCPGGTVVCSASDDKRLCINGMSYSRREMKNSNAAVVVNVLPNDVKDHPLGMLEFIDDIERKAYNENFVAPAQRVIDYIADRTTVKFDAVKPSYACGVIKSNLNELMPDFINESMKVGLKSFDTKMKGFIKNGVLTGVETRTSSPVRITRDESFQSVNVSGLFPGGEGAGYAGGIISAAVDGIKIAEKVAERFSK